jgi:large repetitive protein
VINRVRSLLVLGGALAVAGALAGGALGFLTVSATGGSAGSAVAGSVGRVTGFALGAGAVTPTASPTVPVSWNAATLANGGAVTGYVVHRYSAGNAPQSVGAGCSGVLAGTSCSESGVPDGTWTYGVQAKFDNWLGAESARLTVKVDTSAPTITSRPSTPSASSTPSFSFSHPSYSSFKCKLDAGGFASCSSPSVTSSLADGSHTFQVEAVDANGVATTAASYTWSVGTAAPTLTAQPASLTNQTSATFIFTDGAYSRFTCKLDAGSASACNSGAVTYAGPLAGGSHTFTVFATDADGAQTQSRTYTWTIDTTAPAVQTLQMFDNDHDGKVDHVVATFSEPLAACAAPCTTGWTLANVPSGGTLSSVTISGSTATLNLTEGSGAPNTAVGSFTVALAATGGITDIAGNHSSFAAQSPADKAAPVPISVVLADGSGTIDAGDTASVTFSEPLAVASVCSTWSGNGSNQSIAANGDVVVTVTDNGAANDTLSSVTSAASCGGTVHFGAIDLGSTGWIAATTTYSGTGKNKSRVGWTAATATLSVTLGTPSGASGALSGPLTATYTPDAAITDAAGNPVAGSVTATSMF